MQHCGIRNNANRSISCKAWAQAVKVDGTIIVLHSGNYEVVGLRHRDSQTLYVSDLIEPPTCRNPGYGKLHVGIYVAGVQDTIDRKKQAPRPSSTPPSTPSSDRSDGDDGNIEDDRGDGAAGGSKRKNDQRDPGGPSKRSWGRGGWGGAPPAGAGRGKASGARTRDAGAKSVSIKVCFL